MVFTNKIKRLEINMANQLASLLKKITDNYAVIVFLISMIPLIELKGAIPIGTKLGEISLIKTATYAYLGSTVVCVLVFFLLKPIFKLMKKIPIFKKLVVKVEQVFKNKAQKIADKSQENPDVAVRKMMMWGLFIFVAVPFPVTGVWTGTAISVFLEMKFKDAVLPLALGNLVAGAIITLLTYFFGKYVDMIIYVLFAIAIVMLAVFIIKVIITKPVAENANESTAENSQESKNV